MQFATIGVTAIQCFHEVVTGGNDRDSRKAIELLGKIPDDKATAEMINLFDVPPSFYVNDECREALKREVESRTEASPDRPSYDPHADFTTRSQQKQRWLEWMSRRASAATGAVTRPSG